MSGLGKRKCLRCVLGIANIDSTSKPSHNEIVQCKHIKANIILYITGGYDHSIIVQLSNDRIKDNLVGNLRLRAFVVLPY